MNRYEELEMELNSIDRRKKEINEEMTNISKKPALGDEYYFISNGMDVAMTVNTETQGDIDMFQGFNYFETEEETQVMADKFKAMLKEYKTNPKKNLYIKYDSFNEKLYYGRLGDKTNIVYKDGTNAHVGDIVIVTSKDCITKLYNRSHHSFIFKTDYYEDGAVMGFATDIRDFNARYNITKHTDWSELEEGYKYDIFEDIFVTSEPPVLDSLEELDNE